MIYVFTDDDGTILAVTRSFVLQEFASVDALWQDFKINFKKPEGTDEYLKWAEELMGHEYAGESRYELMRLDFIRHLKTKFNAQVLTTTVINLD